MFSKVNRLTQLYHLIWPAKVKKPGEEEQWFKREKACRGDSLFDRQEALRLETNQLSRLGAINKMCTRVVGSGWALAPCLDRNVLGLTELVAKGYEVRITGEFRAWSNHCDAQGQLGFLGLQALAFRSMLENGDCFLLLGQPLTLKLIEGAQVCNAGDSDNSERLVEGVEKDSHGAPIGYHLLTHPPGSIAAKERGKAWTVVPLYDAQSKRLQVMHVYQVLQANGTRGLPFTEWGISLEPLLTPTEAISQEIHSFFDAQKQWFVQAFCQKVYEVWLEEMVRRGRLLLPGFVEGDARIRAAYSRANWIDPDIFW